MTVAAAEAAGVSSIQCLVLSLQCFKPLTILTRTSDDNDSVTGNGWQKQQLQQQCQQRQQQWQLEQEAVAMVAVAVVEALRDYLKAGS